LIQVVCEPALRPVTINFRGALDAGRADEFRLAFRCVPSDRDVILDLRDVTALDWSGLEAIIGGIRGVQAAGRTGIVCGARGPVARLLEVAGARRFVTVVGSREEALTRVGPADAEAVVADAIRLLHDHPPVEIGRM
jgi:anti-anti-sigma factor